MNLISRAKRKTGLFFSGFKKKKPIILMYHRIDTEDNDPHKLCVSPENFRDHLALLKETRTIVPFSEIQSKTCPNDAVALTFDDGYVDNLTNALPILEEFSAPATIFVTAGLFGRPFVWDAGEGSGRCMTEDEVRSIAQNPLIEIGAHTMTHPKLSTLSKEAQEEEIKSSKEVLENLLEKQVTSFAYPFGDYNDDSVAITGNLFKQAVVVRAGSVTPLSNSVALPRFIVRDWTKEQFKKKLMTFK